MTVSCVSPVQTAKHRAGWGISNLIWCVLCCFLPRSILFLFSSSASVRWNVTVTKSPDSMSYICLIPIGVFVLCVIPWAIILWKEWFTATRMTSLLDALQSTVHCQLNFFIILPCAKTLWGQYTSVFPFRRSNAGPNAVVVVHVWALYRDKNQSILYLYKVRLWTST